MKRIVIALMLAALLGVGFVGSVAQMPDGETLAVNWNSGAGNG